VPVTLKRFLALEFVLTFGILFQLLIKPLRRSSLEELGEPLQAISYRRGRGRKDKVEGGKSVFVPQGF
jgi:hypothetical protein